MRPGLGGEHGDTPHPQSAGLPAPATQLASSSRQSFPQNVTLQEILTRTESERFQLDMQKEYKRDMQKSTT